MANINKKLLNDKLWIKSLNDLGPDRAEGFMHGVKTTIEILHGRVEKNQLNPAELQQFFLLGDELVSLMLTTAEAYKKLFKKSILTTKGVTKH